MTAPSRPRTASDIVFEVQELEERRSALYAELEALTGKSYEEFLAGMAALLEPTEGYEPGSTGAHHLQAWREQFGGGL